MTINAPEELLAQLERLYNDTDDIAKDALKAGAGVVADEIRKRINELPRDKYRRLREGEIFSGVAEFQRRDLQEGFGITPIKSDNKGTYNVKVGFDGYGSVPTKKYPKGFPNPLLARAIDSGSSVRRKLPFFRSGVKAAEKPAIEAMENVINKKIEEITNGR